MERAHIGQRSLYGVGTIFITFLFLVVLKFVYLPLCGLIAILYVLTLFFVGLLMIIASLGFLWSANRFGSSPALFSAILIVALGVGYIAMAASILLSSMLILGVAISIIKPSLFFYSFTTMYYFFEREFGKPGGVGSILILFFSSSHHFFVFSAEFYSTLPGVIFTTIAALGYILQGYSMGLSAIHRVGEIGEVKAEEGIERFPITRPF